METVRIFALARLRPSLQRRLYEAQQEAARVWTLCRDLHLAARCARTRWPTRDELQQATKGQFALHSQTVQMICHQFLANVDTTCELRQTNRKMRYPYKDKHFFPLFWPAQAMSVERGRVVLPMGRGRRSLVFKLDLPEHIGGSEPLSELSPGGSGRDHRSLGAALATWTTPQRSQARLATHLASDPL